MPAPSPTTILFFDHTAKMSGAEISLFHIVTHLDLTRWEPVVVLAEDGDLRAQLSARGIETHVLPLSTGVTQVRKDALDGAGALGAGGAIEIARYVWRLREFARRRGADILHANSLKADLIGGLAGRLAFVPVVWHIHDRIADDYLPSLATRAFRLACRAVPNVIVANSHATLQTLQLPAHSNARVIYNGIIPQTAPGAPPAPGAPNAAEAPVDVAPLDGASNGYASNYGAAFVGRAAGQVAAARGDSTGDLRPSAPQDLQLAAPASSAAELGAPVIGLVGRISPWKGQDVFLRAAAQVRQRYPRARFQIIGAPLFGEQDYEAELRALCSRLGLDENVEWLGFRSDVPQLLGEMTVLAHASKIGEPFGQVVVEAMMAARPLVATDGGGIPEIVDDEKTGLLVPMDDAGALAGALLRLLDDPQWAAQLGRAGQRRALDHFTIGHTIEQFNRLYGDIAARRGARRQRARLRRAALLLGGLALLLFLGRRKREHPRS